MNRKPPVHDAISAIQDEVDNDLTGNSAPLWREPVHSFQSAQLCALQNVLIVAKRAEILNWAIRDVEHIGEKSIFPATLFCNSETNRVHLGNQIQLERWDTGAIWADYLVHSDEHIFFKFPWVVFLYVKWGPLVARVTKRHLGQFMYISRFTWNSTDCWGLAWGSSCHSFRSLPLWRSVTLQINDTYINT